MTGKVLSVLLALLVVFTAARVYNGPSASAATFANPIVEDGDKADPWVMFFDGYYHYIYSDGNSRIYVKKSAKLQDIYKGKAALVWESPDGTDYSKEVWAPELHYLNGKWYIYFAADDGNNDNHRMYVLEGDSQNPQGSYTLKGKITAPVDRWAIDGTVLELKGILYFVWSGWEGKENFQQNLYIAPMSNPWTISGDRIKISSPQHGWEKNGGPPYVNEAPQVLKRNGMVYIIYSASGFWTNEYCLGQLALTGKDPLSENSWIKKDRPVFEKTQEVYAPGHCSFVKSPDGTEDWILYHARYAGGTDRNIRMQKFSWNPDGTPDFGIPARSGEKLLEPSNGLR